MKEHFLQVSIYNLFQVSNHIGSCYILIWVLRYGKWISSHLWCILRW